MEVNLNINPERLWNRLDKIASIGSDPKGGVTRLAWSNEYKESAQLLINWMEKSNMIVRVDSVGNVFGRFEGTENLPAVLTGSHLDTVPQGGKFDGIAGIMASLEAIISIHESNSHKRPLELVAFINEEATQFHGGLFGSKAICGSIPSDFPDSCIDNKTGMSLRDAMNKYQMGVNPDRLLDSKVDKNNYYAFIELHIEQGTYLLKKDLPLAAVSTIAGIRQFFIRFEGITAHAGGMNMNDRKDCMVAAASTVCEVERLSIESGSDTRGTVGYVTANPGVHNTIAGEAIVAVDFREAEDLVIDKLFSDICNFVAIEAEKRGLEFSINTTLYNPPTHCNKQILSLIKNKVTKIGIPYEEMISFPGHDAMQIAQIMPIGMIFLRSSNDGVSHCPEEFTTKDDLAIGTEVLYQTLLDLAQIDIL